MSDVEEPLGAADSTPKAASQYNEESIQIPHRICVLRITHIQIRFHNHARDIHPRLLIPLLSLIQFTNTGQGFFPVIS